MADISLEINWRLDLQSREINMIKRALRGELRSEEIEEAKALDFKIGLSQVTQVNHLHNQFEKLKGNIEDARQS